MFAGIDSAQDDLLNVPLRFRQVHLNLLRYEMTRREEVFSQPTMVRLTFSYEPIPNLHASVIIKRFTILCTDMYGNNTDKTLWTIPTSDIPRRSSRSGIDGSAMRFVIPFCDSFLERVGCPIRLLSSVYHKDDSYFLTSSDAFDNGWTPFRTQFHSLVNNTSDTSLLSRESLWVTLTAVPSLVDGWFMQRLQDDYRERNSDPPSSISGMTMDAVFPGLSYMPEYGNSLSRPDPSRYGQSQRGLPPPEPPKPLPEHPIEEDFVIRRPRTEL